MKPFIYCILAFFLISCESEKEKLIRSEFEKIQENWTIDEVTSLSGTPNPTLGLIKGGKLFFRQCRYSDKVFKTDEVTCGGDAQFDDLLLSIGYRFKYEEKHYVLGLATSPQRYGEVKNIDKAERIINLISGEWEFEFLGDKLYATQLANRSSTTPVIKFTAIRQ